MEKYRLLREAVEARVQPLTVHIPDAVARRDLELVHDPEYLDRVAEGSLTREEVLRIGLPWSTELVERASRSCGATVGALDRALDVGIAASLAGGTHHAFRDRGEGYCLYNDAVVAARVAQRDRDIDRVLLVDLDVHQGNGSAVLAAGDPSIFTLSVHCARNYPDPKEESDLDIALPAGTGDDAYLAALEPALEEAFDRSDPELVIYLAGADPLVHDRLGRLELTADGLAERDQRVLDTTESRGLPTVITMAGGYSEPISATVEVQVETIRRASKSWQRRR